MVSASKRRSWAAEPHSWCASNAGRQALRYVAVVSSARLDPQGGLWVPTKSHTDVVTPRFEVRYSLRTTVAPVAPEEKNALVN